MKNLDMVMSSEKNVNIPNELFRDVSENMLTLLEMESVSYTKAGFMVTRQNILNSLRKNKITSDNYELYVHGQDVMRVCSTYLDDFYDTKFSERYADNLQKTYGVKLLKSMYEKSDCVRIADSMKKY